MTPLGWTKLLLFVAASVVARPASAGLSARLVYWRSGTAESCPDQAELKKAVARRIGYDPFFVAAPYTIVAEMTGNGKELHARARLLDEMGIVKGSRELTGKSGDCAELLTSLALAISLTLDPMAAAAEPEPAPTEPVETVNAQAAQAKVTSPTPEQTPSKPPSPPPPLAKPSPHSEGQSTSLRLDAGLLSAVGWLPAFSPGATVGVTLIRRYWAVGISGAALLPETRTANTGAAAKVQLTYLAVAPCAVVEGFAGCAIGTFGNYAAVGSGIDSPNSANHLHAAAGLRLANSFALGERWVLVLQADAVRILTRPEFLVAGQAVYQPSPWAANLGISVAYRLF